MRNLLYKLGSIGLLITLLSGCAALNSHQQASYNRGKFNYFATADERIPHPSKAANTEDMWVRLRENFSWNMPADNALIAQHRNWLLSKNYYFPKLAEQSQDYIYYVVQALDERGMPFELALLPAIESYYNPYAYSRSHASGLWQFIPSTGKIYGLAQNDSYDARRDAIASTQAALNLLQYLHNRFNGDWYLALAAYNYGATNVEKAMARNAAEGKPTDYWSLNLPAETRNYVPKLLALVQLVGSPEQYALQLPKLYNKSTIQVLTMDSPFSLTQVAELADVSADKVRRLNAGYKGAVSPQTGPYQLILPKEKAELFQQRYAALGTQAPRTLVASTTAVSATPDVSSNEVATESSAKKQAHTVQQGETLWGIARHYQVDVHRLAAWNNMTANSSLQLGQTLTLFNDQ